MVAHEFQSLFRQNPMPMWVYDLETLRFQAVNEAALRLYGYTEEEFLTLSLLDIRPPDQAAALLQEIDQIRSGREVKPVQVWLHQRKDGTPLYAEVMADNHTFGGRESRLVLLQDVTERIRTQALLDLQKNLLEKIARDVSSDILFSELCEGIGQLYKGTCCAIMRPNPDGTTLDLVAAPGLPAPIRYRIEHWPADSALLPASRAIRSGKREQLDEAAAEKTSLGMLLRKFGKHVCWSVPVFSARKEIVATLDFYSHLNPGIGTFEVTCAEIGGSLISILLERDQNKRQLTHFFYDTLETRRTAEEERLRNLEYLERSERRFRTLAENSPDIIYVEKLPERQVIFVNRNKILGHSARRFANTANNRDWIVYEEDLEKLRQFRKGLARNGHEGSPRIELRVYNAKRHLEWIAVRTTVMSRYADGTPEQLLVTVTVISEQKKIEESLAAGRANLEALVENTTDGIWAINHHYELTILNSSFQQSYRNLTGIDIQVGDNLLAKAPADLSETWKLFYDKVLAGERYQREMHFNMRGRDNYYEVSFNPIRNKDNAVVGASVFTRNITAKKVAENELVKANFELDSFVYRASHDLRAPLRSVLGLLNLVRAEEDAAQQHHYLDLIEKSVNRLDTFINDLTHFSRNSRQVVESRPVDFEALLDECAENLRYMENAGRMALHRDIRQQHPFYSDQARIGIILQNLLSNAVKYQRISCPDAQVTVHFETRPDHALLIVSDNGMGIHPDHVPRIFEMFFRASAESYGSGLGLYITRQVIEKLKGTVNVDSKPGLGTTFSLTLPDLRGPEDK